MSVIPKVIRLPRHKVESIQQGTQQVANEFAHAIIDYSAHCLTRYAGHNSGKRSSFMKSQYPVGSHNIGH